MLFASVTNVYTSYTFNHKCKKLFSNPSPPPLSLPLFPYSISHKFPSMVSTRKKCLKLRGLSNCFYSYLKISIALVTCEYYSKSHDDFLRLF